MSAQAKRVERLENPTYMVTCLDGPDTKPLRLAHLEGHLIHIENNNDKYRIAGPMRRDGEIIGSFFLIEADDEEAARAVLAGDPYISSNMYESIEYHHFTPACGTWLGGVIWDRDEIMADAKKHV